MHVLCMAPPSSRSTNSALLCSLYERGKECYMRHCSSVPLNERPGLEYKRRWPRPAFGLLSRCCVGSGRISPTLTRRLLKFRWWSSTLQLVPVYAPAQAAARGGNRSGEQAPPGARTTERRRSPGQGFVHPSGGRGVVRFRAEAGFAAPEAGTAMRELAITARGTGARTVILVGGLGTRLGALVEVGGRLSVDYLIESCLRFGFRDILLLAGHQTAQVARYVEGERKGPAREGARLELGVEEAPRGTAGAVRHVLDRLAERLLLLNGDSFFDVNWLDLVPLAAAPEGGLARPLCRLLDTSRFGVVEHAGDRVVGFAARAGRGRANQCRRLPGRARAGGRLSTERLARAARAAAARGARPRWRRRSAGSSNASDNGAVVPQCHPAPRSDLSLRRTKPGCYAGMIKLV
jgi:hypothetical protein